jgi:hypothetical protein
VGLERAMRKGGADVARGVEDGVDDQRVVVAFVDDEIGLF